MIAALATSAALAFAPPLDRPLRYETTERRPRPDGTIRDATLAQEVIFAADRDGYVATIRTTGYRTALPPAQSAAFDAVMKPMVGGVVRIHLSHRGVPDRVIDGDASWAAMLAALRTGIAGHPADDPDMAPSRAMLAALSATPPDARDARLIATADDLLGMRLPPLDIGARAGDDRDGTVRDADAGGTARYRQHSVRDAGGRVLETDTAIAVSRTTGLVTHSLRRTLATGGAAAPLPIAESETRLID